MNNDKLALTLADKLMAKVNSLLDAESNHGLPKRELEPVVYPIDVNNSGQINLFEDE